MITLPNIPYKLVVPGKGEDENVLVREGGMIPELSSDALPHWELAKKYDLIDFDLGVKLTGAGFPVYKGKGARFAFAGILKLEESGYRVLVVPGNHDYGTGIMGNKKFVRLFKEKFFRDRNISYPKVDLIDEFAFMGLDSTARELNWHDRFFSEGELGKAQLSRLERLLMKPEISSRRKIIYLHHHPFDFKLGMQLKDSEDLKAVIENRVAMLLFGHYHRDEESAVKIYHGTWGIPRCYNAGSSTKKNGETGFQWIINMEEEDPSADFNAKFI